MSRVLRLLSLDMKASVKHRMAACSTSSSWATFAPLGSAVSAGSRPANLQQLEDQQRYTLLIMLTLNTHTEEQTASKCT